MSSRLEDWERRNEAYLGSALAWLRLKLTALAQPERPKPAPPVEPGPLAPPPSHRCERWNPFRRASQDAAPPAAAPSPPPEQAEPSALDVTTRALAEAAEGDPPPALLLLGKRLGLSAFERDTLLLCAAMELDTRIATLCARAQGDASRPYPTFALAMALFEAPAWEALSPERPLRYWRLLDINQPGAQPLTTSALRADERIVNYIKGLNYLDDRLQPLLETMPAGTFDQLPASQAAVAERMLDQLRASSGQRPPKLTLTGRDRGSKQQVASTVATEAGLHLYRLPADTLPAHTGELENLARLWQRESLLLPLALYVDGHDLDGASGPDSPAQRVARFVNRTGGVLFIDRRDTAPADALERGTSVAVDKPLPAEQREAWAEALTDMPADPPADLTADLPARLSGQFNLNLFDIQRIATEVQRDADAPEPIDQRLWQACLAHTRPALERLAEKIDAKATWAQIVLPPAETQQLERIAAQVSARAQVYDEWGFRQRMNRGLGISALFAGESGTGKTMAAEVLANALAMDLYRIDLSAVVSKYIGETEKNLRQVFDAAEDGGAILLFDEADALFGKRSEVKDSHDRYANIEINYLLQRMEAYRGLAILATNMKSALDVAFTRRLRFIVNFPFPAVAERSRLWQSVFPSEVPLEPLDLDRLARLALTGGNIHNIALNAAFLAAQAGSRVTMPLVLDAARAELRKLDRPINEADFRWAKAEGVTA